MKLQLEKVLIGLLICISMGLFIATGTQIYQNATEIINEDIKITRLTWAYENLEKLSLGVRGLIIAHDNYLASPRKIYLANYLSFKQEIINNLKKLDTTEGQKLLFAERIKRVESLLTRLFFHLDTINSSVAVKPPNAVYMTEQLENSDLVYKEIKTVIERMEEKLETEIALFRSHSKTLGESLLKSIIVGFSIAFAFLVLSIFLAILYIKKIEISENKMLRQAQELKDVNVAKEKLFAIIAHDLKSPFNALLGFSEILAYKLDNQDYSDAKTIASIFKETSQNTFIILKNLLDWSQVQTGSLHCKFEHIILRDALEDNSRILSQIADKKEICISIACDTGIQIYFDANMLMTVLRNLTSNAINFSPPKGQIQVEAQVTDARFVTVTIINLNPGLSAAEANLLFQENLDVSQFGPAMGKGTGLGLKICREFVSLNGGKIWAKADINQCKFYFTAQIS